jgi:putative endonuclease
MSTSYQKGIEAELKAAEYLQNQGFHIRTSRYKTPYGEIDIIAQQGDLLIFVEIKHRRNIRDAYESINKKQMERITHAAEHFLANEGAGLNQSTIFRFDVVLLCPKLELIHIIDAWQNEEGS